jgi:di/tricarboxylate transporter
MMTLVATAPNLVVNSELVRQGHDGFNFFAFTPFGVPILIVGVVYMLLARRLLPAADTERDGGARKAASLGEWVEEYGLADREHRLRVPADSSIVGRTLSDLDLRASAGANIIAIERPRGRSTSILQPTEQSVLEAGDVLLIDLADPDGGVGPVRERFGLEPLPLAGGYFNDRAQDIGMAQFIVPAESGLVGKTIGESRIRSRTGLTVIGMRHGTEAVTRGLVNERIRIGDTLLVAGPWRRIEGMDPEEIGVSLLRLPAEAREVLPAPGRAWHAVGCLLLVVVLMATQAVPNVQAALIGCLLMGLFGCIDIGSAYRAINWKTLVLIVGMMPFSIALDRTGGIEIAADWIRSVTSGSPTFVLLALLFATTAALGMFISNTATAILMAPVALAVAKELGASPYPFAMIVALAASTAFMTPVSSPVNTLVVGPGRYTFGDFVKVGVPLALLVLVLCVILVPVIFPVFPADAAAAPGP